MKVSLVFLIALLMGVETARAGHFVGNGSDTEGPTTGIAWFPNGQEISICLTKSNAFPLSLSDSKELLQQAFSIWYDYIEIKSAPLKRNSLRITTDCKGNENLVVLLGTETPLSKEAKKKFVNPAAYAELTSYDKQASKGRGFIWIDSERAWSQPRLLAIFLHEIGHLLGCSHVPGTIMDAAIEEILFHTPIDQYAAFYDKIDWNRELVVCRGCAKKWSWQAERYGIVVDAWERLLGTKSNGAPLTMILEQKNPYRSVDDVDSMTLSYQWGSLGGSFKIRFDNLWTGDPTFGALQFKILLPNGQYLRRSHYSQYFIGTLKDHTNKDHLILLTYNEAMNDFRFFDKHPLVEAPVRLYLIDNESATRRQTLLFTAPAESVEFAR